MATKKINRSKRNIKHKERQPVVIYSFWPDIVILTASIESGMPVHVLFRCLQH